MKCVKKNEKAGNCRLYNIKLFSWLGCGRYSGGGRSRGGIETGEEGWEMWEGIGYVTTGEQYTLRSGLLSFDNVKILHVAAEIVARF